MTSQMSSFLDHSEVVAAKYRRLCALVERAERDELMALDRQLEEEVKDGRPPEVKDRDRKSALHRLQAAQDRRKNLEAAKSEAYLELKACQKELEAQGDAEKILPPASPTVTAADLATTNERVEALKNDLAAANGTIGVLLARIDMMVSQTSEDVVSLSQRIQHADELIRNQATALAKIEEDNKALSIQVSLLREDVLALPVLAGE